MRATLIIPFLIAASCGGSPQNGTEPAADCGRLSRHAARLLQAQQAPVDVTIEEQIKRSTVACQRDGSLTREQAACAAGATTIDDLAACAPGAGRYWLALSKPPPATTNNRRRALDVTIPKTPDRVQKIVLPDGEVKLLSDCSAIRGGLDRAICEELFDDVTECRKNNNGAAGSKCETDAINSWLMDTDLDAGWDSDGDDSDDDDSDEALIDDLEELRRAVEDADE